MIINKPEKRIRFEYNSNDFVRQLIISLMSNKNMNGAFAEKDHDVKRLGIVHDGLPGNGYKFKIYMKKEHKMDATRSINVSSLFKYSSPTVGRLKSLNLQTTSCNGQNKKNIVLGYFMTGVELEYHENIHWYFLNAVHKTFSRDKWLKHIRKYVSCSVDQFSMDNLRKQIKRFQVQRICSVSVP